MARALALLLSAVLLAGALPARAHVRLVWPTSRYGDEMKFAPCGRFGGVRTAQVTPVRSGQSLTVVLRFVKRGTWHVGRVDVIRPTMQPP